MARASARGFTLVEVMVAVLILGVLTALGVSFFGAQAPRQELSGFALELRALLHGSRQTALATGHPVAVLFFPSQDPATPGRLTVVVYEDGDGDFFSGGAGVNFEAFDPTRPAAGPRSRVVDVVQSPRRVVLGPPDGMGAGATLPAPFAGVPVDVDCAFCTGDQQRGAVVFGPGGAALFFDGNGGPLDLPIGGSLTLTAGDTREARTLAVLTASGVVQTYQSNTAP